MAYSELINKPLTQPTAEQVQWMKSRFRGFIPVVIDLETGGFNEKTDALLELAAVLVGVDENMHLFSDTIFHDHIEPFAGSTIEEAALKVNKIDPLHPLRLARPEGKVLEQLFEKVREALSLYQCSRAILVGHNAFFDLKFMGAAIERNDLKNVPFHKFSTFDTVSLGGLAYGQTILAKIASAAGMEWDSKSAHSAIYDAVITADIFCKIINSYSPQPLGRSR